jgi:ADP-ribose pyrophosphatase YjhB (NUDIX family)
LRQRSAATHTEVVNETDEETARYYAALPRKRMAAGAVCRDGRDRILLVRPTYKATWHVPGGVVDADESPLAAVRREVTEELGVELAIGRLLVVDWLPPRPPKNEGLMLLFDGGLIDEQLASRFVVPAAELEEWAFVDRSTVDDLLTPS